MTKGTVNKSEDMKQIGKKNMQLMLKERATLYDM